MTKIKLRCTVSKTSKLLILCLGNDFRCGHDDIDSGDEDNDDDSRLIFYATFPSQMPLLTVLHFIWYLSFLFMYMNYHHYRIDILIRLIPSKDYYYYYYIMSPVTGLFCPVLLLNQRWSPPLRLLVSHCSTFGIMCDVPSIAVFCSEPIECFPCTASKFFLKRLVTVPVAPIITGIIAHIRFHMRCLSIHKLLYFNFFSASFCTIFRFIIIIIIIIIVLNSKYALGTREAWGSHRRVACHVRLSTVLYFLYQGIYLTKKTTIHEKTWSLFAYVFLVCLTTLAVGQILWLHCNATNWKACHLEPLSPRLWTFSSSCLEGMKKWRTSWLVHCPGRGWVQQLSNKKQDVVTLRPQKLG